VTEGGYVTMYKDGQDMVRKTYSFQALEQYFQQKDKPIALGMLDDMLVIQFEPNQIEAFEIRKGSNTINKADMHQTLVLNDAMPRNETALMPLQFSFNDYFHSFSKPQNPV